MFKAVRKLRFLLPMGTLQTFARARIRVVSYRKWIKNYNERIGKVWNELLTSPTEHSGEFFEPLCAVRSAHGARPAFHYYTLSSVEMVESSIITSHDQCVILKVEN